MVNPTECIDSSEQLFPPTSRPYGISFSEWSIRWWRWLLSIPKDINPINDNTGEFNRQWQNDPKVWFLAGTFGGSTIRKCTIPYGKAILFPIINYEASFADEPLLTERHQLENKCKQEIDNIGKLYCNLDGIDINLSEYRIHSEAFEIDLPVDNCLLVKAGHTLMASDGYWLFLHPLARGTHVIQSFGSCLEGKVKIGCKYQLTIH